MDNFDVDADRDNDIASSQKDPMEANDDAAATNIEASSEAESSTHNDFDSFRKGPIEGNATAAATNTEKS